MSMTKLTALCTIPGNESFARYEGEMEIKASLKRVGSIETGDQNRFTTKHFLLVHRLCIFMWIGLLSATVSKAEQVQASPEAINKENDRIQQIEAVIGQLNLEYRAALEERKKIFLETLDAEGLPEGEQDNLKRRLSIKSEILDVIKSLLNLNEEKISNSRNNIVEIKEALTPSSPGEDTLVTLSRLSPEVLAQEETDWDTLNNLKAQLDGGIDDAKRRKVKTSSSIRLVDAVSTEVAPPQDTGHPTIETSEFTERKLQKSLKIKDSPKTTVSSRNHFEKMLNELDPEQQNLTEEQKKDARLEEIKNEELDRISRREQRRIRKAKKKHSMEEDQVEPGNDNFTMKSLSRRERAERRRAEHQARREAKREAKRNKALLTEPQINEETTEDKAIIVTKFESGSDSKKTSASSTDVEESTISVGKSLPAQAAISASKTVPTSTGKPSAAQNEREQKADRLLIDDFNDSEARNSLGNRANVYERDPSSAVSKFSNDTVNETSSGVLELTFRKMNQGGPYGRGGWCGYYTSLKNEQENSYIDASEYGYISLWAKGKTGGENFAIGVADRHWDELGDSVKANQILLYSENTKNHQTLPDEWTYFRVPLGVFNVNKANLASISINFESFCFADGQGQGTVYIDDLALEK